MKETFLKYILVALLPLLLGCQRDDLCAESTDTTPRLVIEFFDFEDPDQLKAAQGLVVIAAEMETPYLGPVNTNGIEIPLRTDENVTEYLFILNAGSDNENIDRVRFSYNPSPEYLNRACGFKVNYRDLQVNLLDDEDNWIRSYSTTLDIISDETETHITLIH